MALLYFFRHGQAGRREDYDQLSELGQEQARLLGDWIRREGLEFQRVYAGGLKRQQQTARLALGEDTPVEIDARWSEFDLDAVYDGIAPQLAMADLEFQKHFDSMQAAIAAGDLAVHRQWTQADVGVVTAWIEGRFAIPAESWLEFVDRVTCAEDCFANAGPFEQIAIFTSATPISIWMGKALGVGADKIMRFAAAMYNSAVTVLDTRHGEVNLSSFNSICHLTQARLRTHR